MCRIPLACGGLYAPRIYKLYIKSSAYMYIYVYAISLKMYRVHKGCLQSIHII